MSTTKTISSRKSHKKTSRHREKLAKARLTDDFTNFLEGQPAFSYAFVGEDGHCACGPGLASVVDLVLCATEDRTYEGPHPANRFEEERAQAIEELPEIVADVNKRIRRLRRADVSFILCWQAFGEKKAHLDWHGDYKEVDMREELIGLLRDEVGYYLM